MKKYALGVLTGLALGVVAPAAAASIVGGSGYLSGWTVTANGEEVCYMPYIWPSIREIECD